MKHNKSIESGCKPLTIMNDVTQILGKGELNTITYNISADAEIIAREIFEQRNKLVLTHLPTETLLKIKEQVEKELQQRNNML